MKQRIVIIGLAVLATAAVAGVVANAGSGRTRSLARNKSATKAAAGRTTYWAIVNQNGHLVQGIGTTGATRSPGTGSHSGDYLVTFTHSVRHCAWVATPRKLISAEQAVGEIRTWETPRLNQVRVITSQPGSPNGSDESGFSLVVVC